MTTQVLYQSDKIKINYEKDCYSIIATDDLKVGELILLEIVIWSPKLKHIIAAVMYDQDLSKELYPRDTDDPGKKVNTNVFRFDENYVLGKVFSKFNHSCVPNCHMDAADFVNNERVYGMWTHRTVKKGEELTIDYVQTHDVSYHDEMKAQFKTFEDFCRTFDRCTAEPYSCLVLNNTANTNNLEDNVSFYSYNGT